MTQEKTKIRLIFQKDKEENQVNHRPARQEGNWGQPAWIYKGQLVLDWSDWLWWWKEKRRLDDIYLVWRSCLATESQSDKNVKKWNNEKYKQNVVQLGQYIGQLSQYKQNMSNRRPWG